LHDNAPAHKTASVYQFLTPKKCYSPLSPPTPQIYLHQTPPPPKLKMKLKGLHFADVFEIQEAITGEVKKVQKEKFSAAFQKLCDCTKAFIYASGAYFE